MTAFARADSLARVPTSAADAWTRLSAALEDAGQTPCQQQPEAWWPEHDEEAAGLAVARCWSCPALTACREYALAAEERWGVWGATTPADRRQEAA